MKGALWSAGAVVLAAAVARGANVNVVAGPMVGHVTDNAARIWMEFPIAGEVSINVIDARRNQAVSGVKVDLEGPSPFTCDVPVNNLLPDHTYRIEVKFEGTALPLPGPDLVIRTAPAPGDEAPITIGFGSDIAAAGANPAGAGAGSEKGRPIFKAIGELKPRAFLFLGNVGYLPGKIEQFPTTRRAAYRAICDMHEAVRRLPELQELFRTTPCYGLYNDRDFGVENADQGFVFARESMIAYQKFWPNPDWGTPQTPGCFSTFCFGDVDFFMLDVRTNRSPSPAGTSGDPAATMAAPPALLGEGQLEWLKKNLQASRAAFKVLAAPCTLFGEEEDSWSRIAPAEQRAFVAWLGSHRIGGVLALAGNRPAGEILRVDAHDLGYPLFTAGCSTLTDIPGRAAVRIAPSAQREGQPVLQNNFGTLDFGGQREHRFVTLRVRDESGKTRLEQTLFAGQLRAQ